MEGLQTILGVLVTAPFFAWLGILAMRHHWKYNKTGQGLMIGGSVPTIFSDWPYIVPGRGR